jgi:hypothetical protein
MKAVSRIRHRSERQLPDRLRDTYVDTGILDALDNENHQILFGRRGTGKTHVLKVLQSQCYGMPNLCCHYIDTRVMGSSSQYSDISLPIQQRALALFRDILSEIHSGILEFIIDRGPGDANAALEAVDQLAASFMGPIETARLTTVVARRGNSHERRGRQTASLGLPTKLSSELEDSYLSSRSDQAEAQYSVMSEEKVVFPAIAKQLSTVLSLANSRLLLLFDEWSSLAQDIQPILAEFLKRSVMPCSAVSVKIASIEYRSRFSDGNVPSTGFELGADISAAPYLDDYFVFDQAPERLQNIFADILYRHLSSELPVDFLRRRYQVSDLETFINRLFWPSAFSELTRAAEGVVRDLINIFSLAFTRVHKDQDELEKGKIGRPTILAAASDWFEYDKIQHLNSEDRRNFEKLEETVVRDRRSRFFLVPSRLDMPEHLKRLIDSRVIHIVHKGFAVPGSPGQRFTVCALDYGSYVGIINPARVTSRELSAGRRDAGVVLPFSEEPDPLRLALGEADLQ